MKSINLFIFCLLSFVISVSIYPARYLSTTPNSYTWSGSYVNMGYQYIDHWANHSYSWYLNENGAGDGLSINDVEYQAQLSHSTWTSSSVMSTDLSLNYLGRTSATWGEDGINTVFWAEDGDPAFDYGGPMYGINPGGITIVKVNSNYEIIEADVILNGKKDWIIAGSSYDTHDIRGCLTHEVGHTIGLGHPSIETTPAQTMWVYVAPPDDPRDLANDDIAGVSFLYGGKLTDNNTLSDYAINYFDWSISIISGKTLTIPSGANVVFSNGVSLTVNGILNAQGTSTNRITFISTGSTSPGSWGTITFNGSGSSGSNLNYTNINYGSGVQCLNGANVTIENSYIKNCTNGIYIYNSAPQILANQVIEPQQNGIYGEASGMYPSIFDNTVTRTPTWIPYRGIWFYSSTRPYVAHNDVSGFSSGGCFGGSVVAVFSDASSTRYNPNNRFRNNGYGIEGAYSSTVYAGIYVPVSSVFCYNSCYNNTVDVSSTNGSTVYAQVNFWGGGNPVSQVDGTSSLYTDYVITSPDPWAGIPKIATVSTGTSKERLQKTTSHETAAITDSNITDVYTVISLEKDGKIDDAIAYCKSMIAEEHNSEFALTMLYSLKNKYLKDGVISYLENIPVNFRHYASVLKLLADNALQNDRFDEALAMYDKLIKDYPNDYQGINARFEELFAYLNIKNDKEKSRQILSDITSLNLKGDEWAMRTAVAENLLNGSNRVLVKPGLNETINFNSPRAYSLYQNYPNPFNPTTTIHYELPVNGPVTIKVYDILGREVATLINGYKTQGSYDVNFNASKLSSGMYIYQLRAGNYISTKKMLLLK